MQNRADPYAGDRALAAALQDPPSGPSPDEAVAEVRDVLDPIGDTFPRSVRPTSDDRNNRAVVYLTRNCS